MIFPQPRPQPVSAPIFLVRRRRYLFHVSERVRSRPGIRAALLGRLQFKKSENVSKYYCDGIRAFSELEWQTQISLAVMRDFQFNELKTKSVQVQKKRAIFSESIA